MEINNKNVYNVIKNKQNSKVLILYNISNNHYVGIPIYDNKKENYTYITSIQKYLHAEEIQEYKKSNIKNNIYVKGKKMHVSDNDFKIICKEVKTKIINNLENKINYNNINDLKFLKWCYDSYYFHYDLEIGTAKIENMINFSYKRITEPFYFKNKIYYINKKQVNEISDIIKKYYTYNFVEKGQLKYNDNN